MAKSPHLRTIRCEETEQALQVGVFKVRSGRIGPTLRNHANYVALGFITFETGTIPGTQEHLAARIEIEVRNLRNPDKLLGHLGEAGAIHGETVQVDGLASPVSHKRLLVVGFRPSRLVDKDRTNTGATAEIFKRRDDLIGKINKETRVAVFPGLDVVSETHIPTTTVVGVSAGEDVHERIDRHIVNVAHSGGVELHFRSVGTDPDNSATQQGQLRASAINRVNKTEIPDRNVDPTVDTHLDTVGGVVSSASVER